MKPLPDVCIAPYEAGELAPNEPLCAPATYRVTVWLLLTNDYYLIRQIRTTGGQTEFIARPEWSHSHIMRFGWLQNKEVTHVTEAIKKGEFARSLYFDLNGRLASSPESWYAHLWISPYGRSFWNSRSGVSGEFKWKGLKPKRRLSRVWRLLKTNTLIERDVQEMLRDEDSDCSFAWRWVHLSSEEQEQMLFPVGNGIQDEFLYFLRAVAWADPIWNDIQSFAWLIEPVSSASAAGDGYRDVAKCNVSVVINKIETHKSTPQLTRLVELLLQYFKLSYPHKVSHYTLVHQVWNWDGVEWRIPIPIPSHHERLEARLRLREWLQDKVAPDEILTLLGEA